MSCCCDSVLDLGCIDPCGTITIGTATQTGNHKVYLDDGVKSIYALVNVTSGNSIEITDDGEALQPGYDYTINVINPDGTEFTETVSGTVYDCWSSTVRIIKSVTLS